MGKRLNDHLERAGSHVTEELADRVFRAALPPEWIANPFQKDYGKDYHIEVVGPNGRIIGAFYVQLKGTRNCRFLQNNSAISFPLEKKYLVHYMTEVTLPVFLVVVDVLNQKGYWLLVQSYLLQNPGWEKPKSFTLHLPASNALEENFKNGVSDAFDWMPLFQQKSAQDRVHDRLRELGAKDRRFRIEASLDKEIERLSLIAIEPMDLTVRYKAKRTIAAKANIELFERGLPAEFGPGELIITGSTLLNELTQRGGRFQWAATTSCQLSLAIMETDGRLLWEWNGIPALITAGIKEARIESQISTSPISIHVGPLSNGSTCAIQLSIASEKWLGHSICSLAYFERIRELISQISGKPRIRVDCECEGNEILSADGEMDSVLIPEAVTSLISQLEKARYVARHFKIDPVLTKQAWRSSPYGGTEIAYALLTNGKFEIRENRSRLEAKFSARAAKRLLAQESLKQDLLLVMDETMRVKFLGVYLNFGRIAWHLAEAEMETSEEEILDAIRSGTLEIPLTFLPTPTAVPTLKQLSEDELTEALKDFD